MLPNYQAEYIFIDWKRDRIMIQKNFCSSNDGTATATNNRKKEAHHGTYIEFASSRLPLHHGCYARFISGNRDDFFAVDVRRHAVSNRKGKEMIIKFRSVVGTIFLGVLLLAIDAHCAPKVTQAAYVYFKSNRVIALAVEEFGKAPTLLLMKDGNAIFSIQLDSTRAHRFPQEFGYTNPFLRFKAFDVKGMPSPILMAVLASPGGSDEGFSIHLITEIDGKIKSINPGPIGLSIQDGIYLGYINHKHGIGMITCKFVWDAAHYAPHKYHISIYKWEQTTARLFLDEEFTTEKQYRDEESALAHYGLPSRNFRNEVVMPEEDISTLGIEGKILLPSVKDK
jgi:hypothetical protein